MLTDRGMFVFSPVTEKGKFVFNNNITETGQGLFPNFADFPPIFESIYLKGLFNINIRLQGTRQLDIKLKGVI